MQNIFEGESADGYNIQLKLYRLKWPKHYSQPFTMINLEIYFFESYPTPVIPVLSFMGHSMFVYSSPDELSWIVRYFSASPKRLGFPPHMHEMAQLTFNFAHLQP